jgi:hypothetical protein
MKVANRREEIDVSAEYIALQYKAGELAFTNDFDQAGHLQLSNVMRESRGTHAVGSVQSGAGRRSFARRDLP